MRWWLPTKDSCGSSLLALQIFFLDFLYVELQEYIFSIVNFCLFFTFLIIFWPFHEWKGDRSIVSCQILWNITFSRVWRFFHPLMVLFLNQSNWWIKKKRTEICTYLSFCLLCFSNLLNKSFLLLDFTVHFINYFFYLVIFLIYCLRTITQATFGLLNPLPNDKCMELKIKWDLYIYTHL